MVDIQPAIAEIIRRGKQEEDRDRRRYLAMPDRDSHETWRPETEPRQMSRLSQLRDTKNHVSR